MKKKICGIYAIINQVSGKRYIGQSVNIYRRWWEHQNELKNNSHQNIYLQRAYNKYGQQNFSYCILEECNEEQLTEREFYYINLYKNNYNLREAGPKGHHSKESKIKNRLAHLGKKASEETKLKMSQMRKGRPGYMKGKHHSEETKKKMSEAKQGYKPVKNEEIIRKLSEAGKRNWQNEEYRRHMSLAHKKNREVSYNG